ncbi:hypothetical protein B7494_g30 [Chlorociboria aeruginascens]|nr:hypothetical protein B7494_g30 [Chlorociboria aeruginascens]
MRISSFVTFSTFLGAISALAVQKREADFYSILAWDTDSDVQITEESMHYLAAYYNMTVFHYKTPRIVEGRDYMLEINPHYIEREQTDRMNLIDARWIDTTSGLFIDITAVRYNHTHPNAPGILSCKDGHEFRDTYIFPLRSTYFEGTPAKIPVAYKELLEAEYGKKALTLTEFEGHKFDDIKLEWIPIPSRIDEPSFLEGAKKSDMKQAPVGQEAPVAKEVRATRKTLVTQEPSSEQKLVVEGPTAKNQTFGEKAPMANEKNEAHVEEMAKSPNVEKKIAEEELKRDAAAADKPKD